MTTIYEFAPAKINLYLHITGRQSNGYHDLDSLVAFASIGDEVTLEPADRFSFKITGTQAAHLAHEDHSTNLVVKAAHSLAELTGHKLNVALTLDKKLPVASGIGGGSSDAAAALRALARHWGLSPDDPRLAQAAALHGQDVPVCLKTENNYMTATGVTVAPKLPHADIVLVNPNKALPTPDVYQEYKKNGAAFSPVAHLEDTPTNVVALVSALQKRGNDLYVPACRLMPGIAAVIATLDATPQCLLARMSGSGATCFGLYSDSASAASAAAHIHAAHPDWWVEAGMINV